ncbi:MAG: hypothetical protein Kow00124_23770 [Anaerolineae bacterium]
MQSFHVHRITLILTLILALLLAGCSLASEPIPAGPIESGPLPGEAVDVPVVQPRMASGAAIFQERCASCHGPAGAGDGSFAARLAEQGAELPDLSDPALARARSPRSWYSIITNGTVMGGGLMPPWADALTDAQRWDVTYFLYALSIDEAQLARGETLYNELFAKCYGANGEEAGFNDPAQMTDRDAQAIYDEFIRDETKCPAGAGLSEDDAWLVAFYVLTLPADTTLTGVSLEPPPIAAEPTDEPPAEVAEEPSGAASDAPGEQAAADPAQEPTPSPDEVIDLTTAGVVTGTVTNGSAGDVPLAGVEVTLTGLRLTDMNTVEEFFTASTTSGEDGSFRFEGLQADLANSAYVVDVVYNDVQFSNGVLVNPIAPEMDLSLTVYDTVSDPSLITVDSMHVLIQPTEAGPMVVQLYVFSNAGNGIYVSPVSLPEGIQGTVAVAVPQDATALEFDGGVLGDRFIRQGESIYDTQQVYPGRQTHTLMLRYLLPAGNRQEVAIPILYDTAQVTVMAQEGQTVRSNMLTPGEAQAMDTIVFNTYTAEGLGPGDTLSFTLRTGGGIGSSNPLAVALVAAGLLLIGVMVYLLIARRGAAPEEAGPEGADDLEHLLAELDEELAEGKINRFEYEARRAALLAGMSEDET